MVLIDYVLPAIIVLGVLYAVHVLVKDNDVDVNDSNLSEDKPSPPPAPKPTPQPPVDKQSQRSKPKGGNKSDSGDLKNMSKNQLIKLAQKKGVKVNSRMRKDHIIRKLK
mgnify:FL=1